MASDCLSIQCFKHDGQPVPWLGDRTLLDRHLVSFGNAPTKALQYLVKDRGDLPLGEAIADAHMRASGEWHETMRMTLVLLARRRKAFRIEIERLCPTLLHMMRVNGMDDDEHAGWYEIA